MCLRIKMIKTSIRFFDDIPVRAVWDEQSSKWWFCAADIAEALTKSKNPRTYWSQFKRRNPQLITICKQLKLTASDGKIYMSDVVDEDGVNTLIALVPSKKSVVFKKWLTNLQFFRQINDSTEPLFRKTEYGVRICLVSVHHNGTIRTRIVLFVWVRICSVTAWYNGTIRTRQ